MKTYKIDYDKDTQMIKIRWYDEEGNEVAGDAGIYRITIPANTFIWHGDGVSCDGVTGNDEFVYTLVIAGSAPKPIIAPKMKNAVIYFIIDNSANSDNFTTLGYKTYDDLSDTSIAFNHFINVNSVQYDPNFNASQFGYDEKKAMVRVEIDDQTDIIPDFVYSCTLSEGSVYNSGLGSPYDSTPVYNDDSTIYFTGVTQPVVKVEDVSLDFDTKKFTVKYKVSKDNLNSLPEVLFSSYLDNSVKPYIINNDNTATAYCESITQGTDKEEITCVFSVKDLDKFVTTVSGVRSIGFNVQTLKGWVCNIGNGSQTVGVIGSNASASKGQIPYMEKVPRPKISKTNKSSKILITAWSDVYKDTYNTIQEKPVKFYAEMKNGSQTDISAYSTLKKIGSMLSFNISTYNNFGIDPEQVKQIAIEFEEGFFTNLGDNKSTTGREESVDYKFTYNPVDCKPKVNLKETNVNPLYPVIEGVLLHPVHDSEKTTFASGSVKITDMQGNVLMNWEPTYTFNQIELDTKTPVDLREVLADDSVNNYQTEDSSLYAMDQMYSKDSAYENYYGNQIKISVLPTKFSVEGDGINSLGHLDGETDTPEIDRYVLEVETTTSYKHWGDGTEQDYGRVNDKNRLGGFMDWKESAFAKKEELPTYQGSVSWGFYGGGDVYSTVINGGTDVSAVGFYAFNYDAMNQLWSKALYDQTDNEYLKNNLRYSAFDKVETCEKKLYYRDLKKWFEEEWLPANPITFTGETGSEASPSYYTNCFGYGIDESVARQYFDEWNQYFEATHINHFFSMYQVSATNDNTYSFLYETPAESWKFGLPDKPYNATAFEYGSLIYSLRKIDTSNQSNFDYFLYNQSFLHSVPAKLDLSKAKTTNYMFANCYETNEWNFGYWFDGTLNTTDTLENVTSANYMFANDECITAVSDNFSFKNLVSGEGMFLNCNLLTKIPTAFNPTGLQIANKMFAVSKQNGGDGNSYKDMNGNYVGYSKSYRVWKYYDKATEEFTDTVSTTTIDVLPQSAFNMTIVAPTWQSVSSITEARQMWQRRDITSLPSKWNFTSLKDATEMFSNCEKLTHIPTSWVDTDELTIADNMFETCYALTGIHTGFKCKNLQSARGMFAYCTFTQLNDDFQPNSLTGANTMFHYCENFNKIPTAWTSIENIETTVAMFRGCKSLTAVPASWTVCNTTKANSMFEGTGIREMSIDFPNLVEINDMYSDSDCIANYGIMNIGGYYMAEIISQPVFAKNQYVFRVEDLGKTENIRTSSKVFTAITLSLHSIEIPTREEDMDKFTDSILYMLDHLWTGTTVPNPENTGNMKNYTHDRISASSKRGVAIYFTQSQLEAIKDMMLQKAPEHTALTQQLVNERWNTAGSYNPQTDYELNFTGW